MFATWKAAKSIAAFVDLALHKTVALLCEVQQRHFVVEGFICFVCFCLLVGWFVLVCAVCCTLPEAFCIIPYGSWPFMSSFTLAKAKGDDLEIQLKSWDYVCSPKYSWQKSSTFISFNSFVIILLIIIFIYFAHSVYTIQTANSQMIDNTPNQVFVLVFWPL